MVVTIESIAIIDSIPYMFISTITQITTYQIINFCKHVDTFVIAEIF